MLTVTLVLILAAILTAIASAFSPPKCPLWVSVILLCVVLALQVLPK
jgi:hypothetical protein